MMERRLARATVIALTLIIAVLALLSFADSYAVESIAKRCAASFATSKWPMYFGCAMAAHEGLAAGLLGGAGALFAAWLAYEAIQEQISVGEKQRLQQQTEAKAVAAICIAPPVQAAAAALAEVVSALKAQGVTGMSEADKKVEVATSYVETALRDPAIQEIMGDLSLDDRLIYHSIVGTLRTFVNISNNPSPALIRTQRLRNLRRALMNIHTYLKAFDDTDLASVYIRDSNTKPSDDKRI